MRTFKEEWKTIPRFEGYQISNKGRVKSLDRTIITKNGIPRKCKGKIRSLNINSYGYYCVTLNKSKKETFKVHTLVGRMFTPIIPNLIDPVYDHDDNNKLNNYYTNIKMISCRENSSKDRKNKTSKYTGVSLAGNSYRAQIKINGKRYSLGSYKKDIDASNRYQSVLQKHLNGTLNIRKL